MEKKEIYTTNAEGIEFTLAEAQAFLSGEGYHGNHGCYYCPENHGYEQGSSRICGPCGQQNCWITLCTDEDEEEY